MPFTDVINRAALDHIFQKATWTQPGNLSLGLSTTTPTLAGGNITEPSGNAYARVVTDPLEWTRTDSDIENNVRHDFPEATGSWGTLTHFVLLDGSTLVAFGSLTASQAVSTGQQPYFNIGELIARYI